MNNNFDGYKELNVMKVVWSQVLDSLSEWEEDGKGGFRINASVKMPGIGQFGLVSLTGNISRFHKWYNFWKKDCKYKCHVQAVCLPLANESTEIVTSLESAKEHTVEKMKALAASLVLISNKM